MTFSNIDFDEPNMVPASSICESIFDGTHDSPKQQDYGFKLVTSRHIKANKVITESAYFINEDDYTKINKRSRLQIGDVLFTMIGTVGEVCRLSVEPDFAIKNIGVFRPAEVSDSVWIYYYLISPEGRKNIEAAKRGTTQQFMGLKELREFPVNFPKDSLYRHNQMKILELLDAKIDANNVLTKTLEDVAQTIFKSWFIDFDPVKTKMAGEKPAGMDAATAALFPDSMEESELGSIPEGWKVEKFGEVNNLLMGQSPPGDTYNSEGEGLPFYQGRTDFGFRFPKQRIFCTQENRVALPGETLISVRAPVGDVNQAIEKCIIGRGVASALHKSNSGAYTFSLLKSLYPRLAYFNGEGTVFGAINRSDFNGMLIVEPPTSLVERFEVICGPMNAKIRSLFLTTEALIQLRDSLLPRLISGELQIPEEMLAS